MTEAKFKVGNRVYALYRGYGTVTAIYSGTAYPIEVTWDECKCADLAVSTFTKDGRLSQHFDNDDTILTVVEKTPLKGEKEMEEDSLPKDAEDTEEAKCNGLIEDSAINPAYYQVEGTPEAIDIMTHLMTKEQLEGFLWGNIIKYAYRYGRKGDKKETAGKIEWYAQRLKELVQ